MTRAALPTLPARSSAVASRVRLCGGTAPAGIETTNEVTIDDCGGLMTRVGVSAATPPALKVTERIRPASWTVTMTVVCCPALTCVPDVAPVILTVGGTASRTTTLTGAASTTCPLVSVTEPWMAIDDPGIASSGTMKPNASERVLTGGAIARVAASTGLPVCALKLTCATPTSSTADTVTSTCSPLIGVRLAGGTDTTAVGGTSSAIGTCVVSGGPRRPDVSVAMAETLIRSPGRPSDGTAWKLSTNGPRTVAAKTSFRKKSTNATSNAPTVAVTLVAVFSITVPVPAATNSV